MHFILDKTFDILHAFLSSVVAKLTDLKNSPIFLAHPVFTMTAMTHNNNTPHLL